MRRFLILAAMAVLSATIAGPAVAGDTRDKVHADSFGNLVIHSSAGYKRIIVGQGEAAEGYNETGSYYEPERPRVVHGSRRVSDDHIHCWRPPHRWQGRSYMYGLPDHVVPQAPLVCG